MNRGFFTEDLGRPVIDGDLSPASCDRVMVTHATDVEGYTANQIAQAAVADMQKKQRNARLRARRKQAKADKLPYKQLGTREPYVFVEQHVKDAISPAHLVHLAIENPTEGDRTGHPPTMRLYRSYAALRKAAEQLAIPLPKSAPEPADVALPL